MFKRLSLILLFVGSHAVNAGWFTQMTQKFASAIRFASPRTKQTAAAVAVAYGAAIGANKIATINANFKDLQERATTLCIDDSSTEESIPAEIQPEQAVQEEVIQPQEDVVATETVSQVPASETAQEAQPEQAVQKEVTQPQEAVVTETVSQVLASETAQEAQPEQTASRYARFRNWFSGAWQQGQENRHNNHKKVYNSKTAQTLRAGLNTLGKYEAQVAQSGFNRMRKAGGWIVSRFSKESSK